MRYVYKRKLYSQYMGDVFTKGEHIRMLPAIPHIAKPLTSQANGRAEKLKGLMKINRIQIIDL